MQFFFIILTYLLHVLFTFYIQGVLKFKKKNNSGAKRLISYKMFLSGLCTKKYNRMLLSVKMKDGEKG